MWTSRKCTCIVNGYFDNRMTRCSLLWYNLSVIYDVCVPSRDVLAVRFAFQRFYSRAQMAAPKPVYINKQTDMKITFGVHQCVPILSKYTYSLTYTHAYRSIHRLLYNLSVQRRWSSPDRVRVRDVSAWWVVCAAVYACKIASRYHLIMGQSKKWVCEILLEVWERMMLTCCPYTHDGSPKI